MSTELNFNELPDNSGTIEPGVKILTVSSAEVRTASTGSTMLECNYTIDGTTYEMRFDKCTVKNKEGKPFAFGQAKLKRLIQATGIVLPADGKFTLELVAKLIVGKKIKAEIEYTNEEQKYFQIKGTEIFPLEEEDLGAMAEEATTALTEQESDSLDEALNNKNVEEEDDMFN